MKPKKTIQVFYLLVIMAFTGTLLLTSCSPDSGRDIYQLKIYTISDAEQENRMDGYLENAYLPALGRAGIPHVGIFKPVKGSETYGSQIFVLIPFHSFEQMDALQELLYNDDQFLEDGKDYIDAAHDNPPFERQENTILKAFAGFPEFGIPEHNSPPSDQIYELRSYHGPTEKLYEAKVEMFNDAGEIQLFVDLGFQPVFFGEVISGPSMPNLMYMTTFSDTTSNKEHWKSFVQSPDWDVMKNIEKYKHTVSHIDRYFLHPTEYSGI